MYIKVIGKLASLHIGDMNVGSASLEPTYIIINRQKDAQKIHVFLVYSIALF